MECFVERRMSECGVDVNVLVDDESEHRETREDGNVAHHEPTVVDGDGTVVEDYDEDHLDYRYDQPAVHHELAQTCRTLVRQPSVPQQQSLHVHELHYLP